MKKFAATALHYADIPGHPQIDPDNIDWEIMCAVRKLAARLELFDPAMYGAQAGQIAHGHACEMSEGNHMIFNMHTGHRVGGLACNNDAEKIIPNHYHVVIVCDEWGYVITLCKGIDVVHAIPGKAIIMGESDPQVIG